MNIGDTVQVKDVRRASHAITGHPAYFDNGIDIEGTIKDVAIFLNKRVLIEFTHDHRPYHVWMHEFDLENRVS